MSGIWGNKLKLSIFGESHGPCVGITINGIKSGIKIDFDYIKNEMKRRAPGQNEYSTPRKEEDDFEILSGVFNDHTTGSPICVIIKNKNTISKDYSELKTKMRPGHSDFGAFIKYDGFNDYRGSGHFSARITAGFNFAGALAKRILKKEGIFVGAHIKSIASIEDEGFDMVNIDEAMLNSLHGKNFPVIDDNKGLEMQNEILLAKNENNSVGGVVECAIINIPSGIGEPFFDSVESSIAHLAFSIPAVKGIEFGKGFDITKLRGNESNDELYIENGHIKTRTNNNGGIIGGLTNGMPIVFRVALKPTASISRVQNTIDIGKMENTTLAVTGRHDPCVALRAIPLIESIGALAVLDFIL